MKIGVLLPIGVNPSAARTPRYADVREAALISEAAGFDSIWVYDHLLFRFPGQETAGLWEPWTILSAIAEATERVELGTLVMCVPFRNPGLLAKMADALDEVSGGRLILGIGAGWHQPEFDAYGYPFDHLASRFEDGVEIIAPLLRQGAVTYDGTYSQAVDAVEIPRGPRPDGPPILIASSGPRMHALTAKWADAWNTCWFGRPTNLQPKLDSLHEALVLAGRDPATLRKTVGVQVSFPDLAPPTDEPVNPDEVLSGTPEEIAKGLREYEAYGIDDVLIAPEQDSADAYRRLADVVSAYRR